jgi:hypothetical protein
MLYSNAKGGSEWRWRELRGLRELSAPGVLVTEMALVFELKKVAFKVAWVVLWSSQVTVAVTCWQG